LPPPAIARSTSRSPSITYGHSWRNRRFILTPSSAGRRRHRRGHGAIAGDARRKKQRLAIPPNAAIQETQKLIRGLLSKEYAENTLEGRKRLAPTLLDQYD